ncbi:hypothetical protein KIPB_010521, partial [Kipferlia bialata]|eukprot:g10521.t1
MTRRPLPVSSSLVKEEEGAGAGGAHGVIRRGTQVQLPPDDKNLGNLLEGSKPVIGRVFDLRTDPLGTEQAYVKQEEGDDREDQWCDKETLTPVDWVPVVVKP